MHAYIEQLVDLTEPELNNLQNCTVEEARQRLLAGDVEAIRGLDGSFALVARAGKTVKLARSLDRPLRYFLAKREEGPALVVADRIDKIAEWLRGQGLGEQFHPSYTRMVPAHYVVEIQLVGCPDPDPVYTRFFEPARNALSSDLNEIGRAYISALAEELRKWLSAVPSQEPIGVAFSGGIDSGAVFLMAYHSMLKLGLNPSRLKAFTLTFGNGPDLEQAREFLKRLDLEMFLEAVPAGPEGLDVNEAIRVVEDYKPLDVECACMGLALCRGIRERYPDWRYLLDGDGGDENLKDYPIEENPELTIRSVINNCMLYHEGWGVGKIKHSLTYSGGLSRSYTRTYGPGRRYGFKTFSPFTRPAVIAASEGIPYSELTGYDVGRLYALKGEIVSRGIRELTGLQMPVFPKRRFQHGALPAEELKRRLPQREQELRRMFHSLYL